MPRLTAKDYLRSHDQLRCFWLKQPRLFTVLNPTEQWQLHDFFQPDKELTDLELLRHRDAITTKRPSLPHSAGRALATFHERTAAVALKQVRSVKRPVKAVMYGPRRERILSVAPLVRPEVDAKQLARAFINMHLTQMRQAQKPTED